MVEIWSTEQYNILYRKLHEFPALGKKIICTAQEILVIWLVVILCVSVLLKRCYEILWLISLSACNDTVIVPKIRQFPVLIWQTLPFHCYSGQLNQVFRVFPSLLRSGPNLILNLTNIRGYSSTTVDPAVSCNRNRTRSMNFPIIWDFPKRMYIYTHTYLWFSWIFGILTEIRLKY